MSKITIATAIAASLELVWECWTNPKSITKWHFASDDWCCPSAVNDLKPGGKYCARMEAKDGSFGFDFEAIYDLVQPPHEITYTMADGRKVTTRFDYKDDITQVTTIFDAEKQNAIEAQQNGWQAILDNFKRYVESVS